jgi:hypothetical protein
VQCSVHHVHECDGGSTLPRTEKQNVVVLCQYSYCAEREEVCVQTACNLHRVMSRLAALKIAKMCQDFAVEAILDVQSIRFV